MIPAGPTVTGYYRYSDIWFDWPGQLCPEHNQLIKAILAHDAICHPDHPLHIDGVVGAQLFIGTLETGEARLLFSSKQIEYIRYWLYTMGMTHEQIPAPYSDCLFTQDEFRTVSPITYENGGALRQGYKQIEKNNKRLKGTNPTLAGRRHTFERVRQLWLEKAGVWVAIDFEAWEREHKMITEFGWRLVYWEDGEMIEEKGHLTVKEYRNYRNGQYVPERRDNYLFGDSEEVTKGEFVQRIKDLFASLEKHGRVYLVFHDNNQDIKYLKSLGITFNSLVYVLPDSMPNSGLFVVDTSDLIGGLLGDDTGNRRGLEKTCNMLGLSTKYFHNAGNDAYYTLEAMISMASGEHIDKQREQRFPHLTQPGTLRVKLVPKPGDSDYESSDDDADIDGPKFGYDETTGKLWRQDENGETIIMGEEGE